MRILIVEDQFLIGKAIQKGFLEESFAVDWATTYADGLHLVNEFDYDTLILDIMLPDGSGLELLKELRKNQRQIPILILTAKDTLQDKILGFEFGADDYLTKPFAFEELLSRVRVLTRRKYQFYGSVLELGALKIDCTARRATFQGKILTLTAKELALLEFLLMRKAHILSREKIAEHLYSEGVEQGSNVIDVFVNKLRRKLEAAGGENIIETIRGEGYVIR